MSFQPPRPGAPPPAPFDTVAVPATHAPSAGNPAALIVLGVFSLGVGGLALWAYSTTNGTDTSDKILILGGAVLSLLGGVLAIARQRLGAAIAAGAGTPFILFAALYIGFRVEYRGALNELGVKLFTGAGLLAFVVAIIALGVAAGRSSRALGVLIAVASIVPVVAFGAIAHIDDEQSAPVVGAIAGYFAVGLITALGGLKGRWGGVTAVIAAGLELPTWITRIQDFEDRRSIAIAGTAALGLIVVLGLIAVATAGTSDAPVAVTAPVEPGYGAFAPTPSAPIVTPHYNPPPTAAPARPVPEAVAAPIARPAGGPATTPVAHMNVARWVADPYHRHELRYWDGLRWTEHVSDAGVGAFDPI